MSRKRKARRVKYGLELVKVAGQWMIIGWSKLDRCYIQEPLRRGFLPPLPPRYVEREEVWLGTMSPDFKTIVR